MKSNLLSLLASTAALCMTFTAFSSVAADKPLTQAQVEDIVKKVIADNPKLIIDSVNAYAKEQQQAASSKAAQNIVTMKEDLTHNPDSPVIGNPNGDVTLVEFFDYHCGYCKHFFPVLNKLLEEDKNVRVVFKEFPILSEDSAVASKAALAVFHLDKSKYFAFHTALMGSTGKFTVDMLADKAKEVGIDPDALKKEMDAPEVEKEIDHNKEIAQSLNITGTPTIIIGTELLPGAVELSTLKEKIEEARKAAAKDKK